ncbi:TMV resistance protein N-like [Pyrus ussuriensis x Pyrus communis]|uniref:TMV resistance protein N-like n=1 Tax=Pyrus ussuriensis x Pyrus communis TaxID=2448454 RepID=A0A5N5I0V8_9ROSA|nr:TMV resistance protein N-like [Pyrus ussuriensis x Pyrus communis]
MNDGIYELIIFSMTTVVAKPELTNTFNFRMGPMSLAILDMAQVFGLRPSGKVVDVSHNYSSTSDIVTRLEYNFSTFKSYQTFFTGFILFVKKNFGPSSTNANRDQKHIKPFQPLFFYFVHCGTSYRLHSPQESYPKPDELENWKEIVHQKNQLLLIEAEAEVEIQAPQQARATVVETSESEPEDQEKPLGAKMYQKDSPSLTLPSRMHVSPSRVKPSTIGEATSSTRQGLTHMSSIHPPTLVVTPTSQFNPSTREMLHFVEDNSNLSSPTHKSHQLAATVFGEPIVPEIFVVSEASSEGSGIIHSSLVSKNDPSQQLKERTHPPPPSRASGSIQANQNQAIVSFAFLQVLFSPKCLPNLQGLDEERLYCFLQS